MTSALFSHELVLAATGGSFTFFQVCFGESSRGKILSKKHVERCVDVSERIVPDKHKAFETFQDHADLCGGIPSIVAS